METQDTALDIYTPPAHELTVEQVIDRVNKVHEIMRRAMVKDHHYGVIPGTPKPTLLKPGMELLCLAFRLDPQYEATASREPDGHLTIQSTCTLYHITTGRRQGSGMGSCTTRETKYAYRKASRACPTCGKDTIIKGRAEYGGGWICFAKMGGCGAKFGDTDAAITSQVVGRTANEDLADTENTVLKMSNKRALGAAVLNVTAASDIFTVDLEDFQHHEPEPKPAAPAQPAAPAKTTGPPAVPAPPPATTAAGPSPPPPNTTRLITEKQLDRLHRMIEQSGLRTDTVEAKFGPLGKIAMKDYEAVCGWVDSAGT